MTDIARYEKFPGVFVKRRVGVGDLATGDVCYVRLMYVWSVCETVWRRRLVYKEGGDSSQGLTGGKRLREDKKF